MVNLQNKAIVMKQEKQFMQKAIDLAESNISRKAGGPFGAVVVKDGKIVGQGYNTVVATNDPTAHAEVNAIRDACKNLNTFQLDNCEIYSSCEPCPMCLGAIYWARPKKLYFSASREDAEKAGFDDSMIYNEIKKPPFERIIKTEQLLKKEAQAVFNKWNELDLKIEY